MAEKIKIFQIDAFTDKVFGGNPAAVCVLDQWLPDEVMQNISAENNLSETAFAVKRELDYEIRWFTPTTEVALCGHATLASAHVLFNFFEHPDNTINFFSRHSGALSVIKKGEFLTLDFPSDKIKQVAAPQEILHAFSTQPLETYQGKTDFLLLFKSQKEIEQAQPDMAILKKSKARGIMITAPGEEVDFVSRFFAPGSGVDEDPVTGSAHTTLTPFWSKRLNKKSLQAKQLSLRGGDLLCKYLGDRVNITGQAVTYLIGEIMI
jgi:PhzF family phenazine biosynthesis protein